MADGEYRRLTCAVNACEGEHKAQGYCLRHYRQWQRGGVKQDATNCAHCGKPIDGLQGKTYCGRRCKHAAWKAAHPERWAELNVRKVSTIHTGYCATCGAAWVAQRSRTYCGPACEAKPAYVSQAPAQKDCRVCGAVFRPEFRMGRPSEFCSDACKQRAQQPQKRASRIKRKARQRGAQVETVDPLKVFDRDGWRCKLCGTKTPKAKRGTYEPDAPELDHIVPLSKGGEHSYRNTQCACRRCNAAKGDRPLGQMLLVG